MGIIGGLPGAMKGKVKPDYKKILIVVTIIVIIVTMVPRICIAVITPSRAHRSFLLLI